jgi:hypothetical protein
LNVTTRRFSIIMSLPVAEFRPLRPFFIFNAKFAETGNQNITTGFQGRLDLLEQAFRYLNGLALGKAQSSLKAL